MRDHLVFMLQAPIGAFGAIAVGERRGGFDRPAKAAVLGLVAGALGVDRADEAAHAALAEGYGFGLGLIEAGRLLLDYHTIQVPPQRRGPPFATRRDELAVPERETVLSRREYRTDTCFLAVLWARTGAPWTLDALAEALRQPRYAPYLRS